MNTVSVFSFRMVCAAWIAAAVLFCGTASSEPLAREGRVEFSDGSSLKGKISLTPGSELKIHVNQGKELRVLALDRVQEIKQAAEREEMEQKWRFLEAGKTMKEKEGPPYPVRYLAATIKLADGETINGHLYTTVFYVEGEESNQKVILLAKQHGEQGQTMKDVVYPSRIVFADSATAAESVVKLKIHVPSLGAISGIEALSRGPLQQLNPKKSADGYQMTSPLGKAFFLAVKTGGKIVAGWPAQANEKMLALIQKSLPDSEDFFDDRKVLGVWFDAENSEIYSLMLAARKGKTSLHATKSQPWRLDIYRWKYDKTDNRVMLAGQGHLFRGLGAKTDPLPTVELSEKLWNGRKDGEMWIFE